jgi:hypothetical protein
LIIAASALQVSHGGEDCTNVNLGR